MTQMPKLMPIDFVCDRLDCTGCGACMTACPFGAIEIREDDEGFLLPEVSPELCVGCQMCRRACPSLKEVQGHKGTFFMAWNRDEEVLLDCSSGGMFDALASWVFSRQGVVFGAAMDAGTRELRHVAARNVSELRPLRRSKYYQSASQESYGQALDGLESGRWVLFTGTSCQVAGIISLARKRGLEDRLITMDVLCHGVTSKRVVDAYVSSREKEVGAPVVDLKFRVKRGRDGWAKGSSTTTTTTHLFPEGKRDVLDSEDVRGTFFTGFNHNLFLRESCYRCRYCGVERVSDFTVGDFWGLAPEIVSPWQYWHGVSLLLVNSDKARSMLPELRMWIEAKEVEPREAIPHNRALEAPNERPQKRDIFFKELVRNDYCELIRRYYGREMMVRRIKVLVRYLLGDRLYDGLKKLGRCGR